MNVRGKYTCQTNEQSAVYNGTEHKVVLTPVVGDTDENAKYYNATPSGEITLGGLKDSVGKAFIPGKEYYVDFTPAGDDAG